MPLNYISKKKRAIAVTKSLSDSISKKSSELKNKLELVVEDPSLSSSFKIHTIINLTAATCALVAVQPIPFADLFILSPIQVVMVTYLSKVIGLNMSNTSPKEILTYLISCVGWGVLSQQLVLGLYKTIIPFAGGFTTIPLVYACTYSLGIAAKTLLEAKMKNISISKNELKNLIHTHIESNKNNKITIDSLKRQIRDLDIDSYKNYKQEIIKLNTELSQLKTTYDNPSEAFDLLKEKKKDLLLTRYSKYSTIKINTNLFENFLLVSTENQLRVIETFIAKVDRKEILLNFSYNYISYTFLNSITFKLLKNDDIIFIDNIISATDNTISTKNHILNKAIRTKFIESFSSAKHEIDIRSPWLSPSVVDFDFIDLLDKCLNRGVIIKISYGILGSSNHNNFNSRSDKSDYVIELLKFKLGKHITNGSLRLNKIDSHYKLLICDNEFYIEGSFNFLSFKGSYTFKDCREEGATLGTDKDYILTLREKHFNF